MSTISESNIITIDISSIKENTPGIKLTDSLNGKSYYLPVLPTTALKTDEALSAIWTGVDEKSILPGTPCVRVTKGDKSAIVPLLPLEGTVTPEPGPDVPEIIVPEITPKQNSFYACGYNIGTTLTEMEDRNWKYIYSHYNSVYAIDADDNIFVGGDNFYCQLGFDDNYDRIRLQLLFQDSEYEPPVFVKIVGRKGLPLLFAIDAEGNLWRWGSDSNYASVHPDYTPEIFIEGNFVDITYDGYYILDADGNIYRFNFNQNASNVITGIEKIAEGALQISSLNGVLSYIDKEHHIPGVPSDNVWIYIYGGYEPNAYGSEYANGYLFAIDSNYHLYAIGNNDNGQLGTGNTDRLNNITLIDDTHRWSSVITVDQTTFAIDENGVGYTCGKNRRIFCTDVPTSYTLTPFTGHTFRAVYPNPSGSVVGINTSMQLLSSNYFKIVENSEVLGEGGTSIYLADLSYRRFKKIFISDSVLAIDSAGRLYFCGVSKGYHALFPESYVIPEDSGTTGYADHSYTPNGFSRIATMIDPQISDHYFLFPFTVLDAAIVGDSFAFIDYNNMLYGESYIKVVGAMAAGYTLYGAGFIDNDHAWKQVTASGNGGVAALAEDGTLWVWGGEYKYIEDGFPVPSEYIHREVLGLKFKYITGGKDSILAIGQDNKLYTITNTKHPDSVSGSTTLWGATAVLKSDKAWRIVNGAIGIDTDGSVWTITDQINKVDFFDNIQVKQMTSTPGNWHENNIAYYVLSEEGDLYTWGVNNGAGALGVGDNKGRTQPTKIASRVAIISDVHAQTDITKARFYAVMDDNTNIIEV